MKETGRRRYRRKFKEEVVASILSGDLFIEEAMEKYGILARRTIICWLREYKRKEKKELKDKTK